MQIGSTTAKVIVVAYLIFLSVSSRNTLIPYLCTIIESAKILDECGLKGNLNDLLKLKLEMPTVPVSKREQKRLNKKQEHDARVEAAKLKTTDKPGRHAFTSAPGMGSYYIEVSFIHAKYHILFAAECNNRLVHLEDFHKNCITTNMFYV